MAEDTTRESGAENPSSPVLVALAWLIVLVPLAYGLWQTLVKASALFSG